MLFITSFNKELYELYGKRMVNEFSQYTDGSVSLIVLFESDVIPDIKLKSVEFVCFDSKDHREFILKFGHLHEARGLRIKIHNNNNVDLYQDYRYDAVRFSFKIFSLIQVIELKKPTSYFAWIDADLRCLKKFSQFELTHFFPESNQLMSYLGRDSFPKTGPYSECGFLGFNINHPLINEFLNKIAMIYLNGDIFKYEQWHDCWIWDQTRIEYERRNVYFKNISGKASNTEHPFINCDLGKFFDHLKGPERKKIGKSFDNDYIII